MELRADLAAALLDYATVAELMRAVDAGDAPPPTAFRARGREPVWHYAAIEDFLADRHQGFSPQRGPKTTFNLSDV